MDRRPTPSQLPAFQQPTLMVPGAGTARPAAGSDAATWLLIAIVVAMIAAGAGWLVARQSSPSWNDLEAYSALAQRDGMLAGQQRGYASGARIGRREASLERRLQTLRERPAAYTRGWRAGVDQGRTMARARAGYGVSPTLGGDDYASSALADDLGDYPLSYDSDPGSWAYGAPGSRLGSLGYGSGGRSYLDVYRGGSRPAGY